jgi:hypothetical protein
MDFGFLPIVVVFIIIAVVRAVIEKAKEAANQVDPHQPGQAPTPPARPGGFDEIYRQLRREILAKPHSATPPPPPPPPPLVHTPPAPARKLARKTVAPMLSAAQQTAAHRSQSLTLANSTRHTAVVTRALPPNKFFQSRDDLRRALVMKELLDPPLALRPPGGRL